MAKDIEQQNIEVGSGWTVNKVQKEFEIGESKLNKKELDEAAKKAAELAELEKNFETKTTDKQAHISENQDIQKTTQRKTWMERAKDHSDNLANIERAVSGGNIVQDLNTPAKWPAKRIQNISKRILGKNNIQ